MQDGTFIRNTLILIAGILLFLIIPTNTKNNNIISEPTLETNESHDRYLIYEDIDTSHTYTIHVSITDDKTDESISIHNQQQVNLPFQPEQDPGHIKLKIE